MLRTNRSLSLFTLVVSAPVAAIAAMTGCGADEPRARYEADADSAAQPPDASPETEASTPGDAGSSKPAFDPNLEPVACAAEPCAVELVAGERHFCTRMSDGTARCWGDDTKGVLGAEPGDGGTDAGASSRRAVRVTGLAGAKQLSAGGTTTCAVLDDASVRCWGANDKGQLGLQLQPPIYDDGRHPIPSPVDLWGQIVRVDVGQHSVCAVESGGEVWCWGDNERCQLARAACGLIAGPSKAVLGPFLLVRTAAGTGSTFGVTDGGDLLSWGARAGVAGSVSGRAASIAKDQFPLSVELGPVTSLSVSSTTEHYPPSGGFPQGIAHACAVVEGEVYCWGISRMGALGTGLPDPAPTPIRATIASETAWARQVSAAGEITCVLLTDGTVHCAGDNTFGALGRDPATPFSTFLRPAEAFTGHAVQIATAAATVCALLKEGSVVCWGGNQHGELGQGTIDADPHPAPLTVEL